MQTFLPYANFDKSLKCLDWRRRNKQAVESKQILNILFNRLTKSGKPQKAWINHPAVLMWKGYENSLQLYFNLNKVLCIENGVKSTMEWECQLYPIIYPYWFGDERFHSAHRSKLLEKNYEFYSKYNWKEVPGKPYWWPANRKCIKFGI